MWCYISLVPRPSPHPVFFIACSRSMQKQRGKAQSILSCEDISGRQRWGGVSDQKNAFAHAFFILNQQQYLFCFVNVQHSNAWGRNKKIRPQACSFNGRPSPPHLPTIVIHMIKWTRPSLPFLHTVVPSFFAPLPCIILNENRRTKNGGGLGTRLGESYLRMVG